MERFWSLLIISWINVNVKCQLSSLSFNTPPSMWLDRNWRIPETEEVGSVITRVHSSDNEDDNLEFGLEPKFPGDRLPFQIDNTTGVVYLNESLKGRGGNNMHLYVTVSDGELAAKSEVWVNIVNSTTKIYSPGRIQPPGFPPNFGRPSPPLHLPGQPIFHQKTSPDSPSTQTSIVSNNRTHLLPVDKPINNYLTTPKSVTTSQSVTEPSTPAISEIEESGNGLLPVDLPIKSAPDLTATLIPIVSVCAIFLAVGMIALVFRKKICLGKSNKEEEIKKDSGLAMQDGLAMQQWRGPRAFNNRYEPWERDASSTHPNQIGNQLPNNSTTPDQWEFPRHRLKFFNILGEGAFGQVWKCEALDLEGKDGLSVVAVKTLKENATEKERSDLISELQVMKMLEPHPNVVKLLGCCTEKDPLFVIMEFVSKGKLQSYLRNSRAERYYNNMHGQSRSLTSRDLTSFVYQVAKGMDFLSSNGIIHRDLAARNVLINDEHTCKVADFGFARDVIDSHVYERKSEGRLPIRWMAPESLYDNIFSTKSDVWSFGVLIWEVVTLGSTPYPGLSAADVMKKVRDGYRLDKPEHCRRELYNIMFYCWDKDPKERPSFTECIELLEKLLMTETDYIELERFPDHSYYNMLNISDEKL